MQNLDAIIKKMNAHIKYGILPKSVTANESQLIELFQNLLSNAIKFNDKSSPRITISAKNSNNSWTFCVEDNGIGIAPEHQEKIFLIFHRIYTQAQELV